MSFQNGLLLLFLFFVSGRLLFRATSSVCGPCTGTLFLEKTNTLYYVEIAVGRRSGWVLIINWLVVMYCSYIYICYPTHFPLGLFSGRLHIQMNINRRTRGKLSFFDYIARDAQVAASLLSSSRYQDAFASHAPA